MTLGPPSPTWAPPARPWAHADEPVDRARCQIGLGDQPDGIAVQHSEVSGSRSKGCGSTAERGAEFVDRPGSTNLR